LRLFCRGVRRIRKGLRRGRRGGVGVGVGGVGAVENFPGACELVGGDFDVDVGHERKSLVGKFVRHENRNLGGAKLHGDCVGGGKVVTAADGDPFAFNFRGNGRKRERRVGVDEIVGAAIDASCRAVFVGVAAAIGAGFHGVG
jgi:hypothetical protein